jgi:3-phenylpropionate/trans-cinnamate dioxygenase ferredoxin reductase component
MSPDPEKTPPGDVVIVGGGPAAAAAARTLHQRGAGRVTLVGEESAPPYDRTQLSKDVLAGERDTPSALFPADLDACDLRLGTPAVALDVGQRSVALADGTTLGYDALVLATGARPRRLPLKGTDLTGVHEVRGLAALRPLRDALTTGRRLVVIGGGLIGLEAAAAARSRGVDVTVLEVAEQLLGRVAPPEIAAAIAREHEHHGVELALGRRPATLVDDGHGHVCGVELEDGTRLDADVVLIAVGVEPDTDLAAAAGLDVEDGIIVDDRLRTSAPGVHAAGDVVRVRDADGRLRRRTEAWTPAMGMGQHVAGTLLGDDRPYREVPWMWSDQYELRMQAAGEPLNDLQTVQRGAVEESAGMVVFGLRDGRVAGVAGISRGNAAGRAVRGAVKLIERGTEVRAEQLVDPETDLRRLARGDG